MYGLAATRPALSSRRAARAGCAGGHYGSPQEAVLALQRMAGNRATRALLRQPAKTPPAPAPSSGGTAAPTVSLSGNEVSDGKRENEIVVKRPDGTKYHVFHRIRANKMSRPGATRVGLCHDDERVYFRLTWCEGTQGTIDVGANPQGALKKTIDTALGQAKQGSIDDVINTLENLTVQPFAKAEIADVGSWKISGDFKVDVNKNGFGTPTAGIKGDIGWLEVGVDISGKDVNVTATIPLGKRTVNGKKCPERELIVWHEYDCFKEVATEDPLPGIPQEKVHRDKLYLYFDYAKDTLRSDPKSGTAILNQINLDRLDNLMHRGFRISAINGYTSPEGHRGAGKRFEGNDELSSKRARKAAELIDKRYPRLAMRAPLDRRPGDPIRKNAPVLGKTEHPLLTKTTLAKGPATLEPWKRLKIDEVEGDELDATIVGRFREEHPEESSRMMPGDRAFVDDAGKGTRKRAERMFENLRRVEVLLDWTEKIAAKPGTWRDVGYDRDENCPEDVINEAERKWGTRIPYEKAPPPLCG